MLNKIVYSIFIIMALTLSIGAKAETPIDAEQFVAKKGAVMSHLIFYRGVLGIEFKGKFCTESKKLTPSMMNVAVDGYRSKRRPSLIFEENRLYTIFAYELGYGERKMVQTVAYFKNKSLCRMLKKKTRNVFMALGREYERAVRTSLKNESTTDKMSVFE